MRAGSHVGSGLPDDSRGRSREQSDVFFCKSCRFASGNVARAEGCVCRLWHCRLWHLPARTVTRFGETRRKLVHTVILGNRGVDPAPRNTREKRITSMYIEVSEIFSYRLMQRFMSCLPPQAICTAFLPAVLRLTLSYSTRQQTANPSLPFRYTMQGSHDVVVGLRQRA